MTWRALHRGETCPVCGRNSWCTITTDGSAVKCMRVPSDRVVNQRDGISAYIHSTGSAQVPAVLEKKQKPKLSIQEVTEIAIDAYRHPSAKRARARTADLLGVTIESLEALRVGYGTDGDGKSWTSWPCRDWQLNIVGIVRRYRDGSKKTMKGTRTGLFVPVGMDLRNEFALIVEGGSDTAAAASVGQLAIGRPSNVGGAEWIKRLLRGRRCIVLGENDEEPRRRGDPKIPSCPINCTGCGHCFPGLHGAKLTAEKLGCRWIMPPLWAKDLRDMVKGLR